VVCGSTVFGAPVADAQQQRPPARAHGVRRGEVGVARGVGCGVSEAAREGVLVGSRVFLVSRPPPSQWARVLLRGPAARSGGRALILSRRAHRIEMPRGSPASSSELEFWLASHGQWLVLSRFIKKYYKLS